MCCPSMTGRAERFNAAIAGRPDLMGNRTSLTVYPGMVGHDGKRLYQCEEPFLHHYCPG